MKCAHLKITSSTSWGTYPTGDGGTGKTQGVHGAEQPRNKQEAAELEPWNIKPQ